MGHPAGVTKLPGIGTSPTTFGDQSVVVCVWVGKEFPDTRQNERRIKFIRVGDAIRSVGWLKGELMLNRQGSLVHFYSWGSRSGMGSCGSFADWMRQMESTGPQEDLKFINSYYMGEGRMIKACPLPHSKTLLGFLSVLSSLGHSTEQCFV